MCQYSKEIDYKRPSLLQIYLTVKIYLTCLKCIKFRVLTKNYVLFVSHSLKSKNLNTTGIRSAIPTCSRTILTTGEHLLRRKEPFNR